MNKKGKCGSKGCKKCYFLTIKARAENRSHLPKSSKCPPTLSEEMSWKPSRTWVFSIPTNITSGISRYLSVKKEANSNSSKACPRITMPIRLSNFQSWSAAENLMPKRSMQKLTSDKTSVAGPCWVDWLTVDARDANGISASFWLSNRSSSNCIRPHDKTETHGSRCSRLLQKRIVQVKSSQLRKSALWRTVSRRKKRGKRKRNWARKKKL